MGKAVRYMSFGEFAGDLDRVFDRIVREHEVVVVERDGRAVAVVEPVRAPKAPSRRRGRTAADYAAFLSSAGGWKDMDVDKFIDENYRSRRISSRPRVEL